MADCFDFMFYESYMTSIEQARELYGEADAATLCLAIIYFGVRRETKVDMKPELRAALETIKPYIVISNEKKEQTAARVKARRTSKSSQARTKGKDEKSAQSGNVDKLDEASS